MESSIIEGFAAWLRSWGAAERTIADRTTIARAFARDVPTFPHCTPDQISAWLGRDGLSQWSRVTYFSHLHSAFQWAAEAGHIETSPMSGMRRPRQPKQRPRPLTPAETARILLAATPQEAAWIKLALYAGLRAHEIAKFRGEDIEGEALFVRGKGGKDAFLPMHSEIAALAAQYPARGWWFPSSRSERGHVSRVRVTTAVSALMSSLGIDGGIHRCRHTFGTSLLRSGANVRVVQTLMRHESLATTQGYLEVVEDERRAAVDLLWFAA